MKYRVLFSLLLFCFSLPGWALIDDQKAPPPTPASGLILLVAKPELHAGIFKRTVVLVTRHGKGGAAVGLILNKPTNHRLAELAKDERLAMSSERIYLGGPVDTQRIVFLTRSQLPVANALRLSEGLYMSENLDVLESLLDKPDSYQHIRVFRGFAGWAPGQLEKEIKRGSWIAVPAQPRWLFSDPETLWQRIYDAWRDDWV